MKSRNRSITLGMADV